MLFVGTPFELNRILLIRILAVIVLLLILWIGTRRMKLVPTRAQVLLEVVVEFVRKGIVIDTLGEKDGKRFMPILMTIFFLTLALNITGTIPGLQIASTGLIGQAIILAVVSYVTFIYAGMNRHGVKFFKNALVPQATSENLTLVNVQIPNEGPYTLYLTNSAGGVASYSAGLGLEKSVLLRDPERVAPGIFRMNLQGIAYQNYRIQYATSLPPVWETLTTLAYTNGLQQIVDRAATNAAPRFYRALTLP